PGHRLPPTATSADEVHLHIGLDALRRPLDVRDPLIHIRNAGSVYARTQRLPGEVCAPAVASATGHHRAGTRRAFPVDFACHDTHRSCYSVAYKVAIVAFASFTGSTVSSEQRAAKLLAAQRA